ncbi:MAG: hypothetical protein RIS47_714 [Bacteroidota bacterium]|jgi:cyclophilin family peptidyl-prolyl cis-trans isomerase
MNKHFLLLFTIFTLFVFPGCEAQNPEPTILMRTTMGDIKIKLYKDTPQHRDNFLKLAKESFYDSLLFHRVIRTFMVQTGDPNSRRADAYTNLGSGGPGYTIPAEFVQKYFHKRGALCAARAGDQTNPNKESSGSQFYIVQGRKYTPEELTNFERQLNMQQASPIIRDYVQLPENQALFDEIVSYQQTRNGRALDSIGTVIINKLRTQGKLNIEYKFSPEQIRAYQTVGGTPFLDGQYTVFGEVIEGMDIVDKITEVETQKGDRPLVDIRILEMKIVE